MDWIEGEIDYGLKVPWTTEDMYTNIIKVFKFWCNFHPDEQCRAKLTLMLREAKLPQTEEVIDLVLLRLPAFLDDQFKLEKLVGEWYLVYYPTPKVEIKTPELNEYIKPKRNPIPPALRHEVFKRDGYRCVDCGATNKERTLHVDHIIPVSQGGSDELSNLQTLCDKCNFSKNNRAWKGGTGALVKQPDQEVKKIDYKKLAEKARVQLENTREVLRLFNLVREVLGAKIEKVELNRVR
jgi:5-methylcytosine-specific restriction protein A